MSITTLRTEETCNYHEVESIFCTDKPASQLQQQSVLVVISLQYVKYTLVCETYQLSHKGEIIWPQGGGVQTNPPSRKCLNCTTCKQSTDSISHKGITVVIEVASLLQSTTQYKWLVLKIYMFMSGYNQLYQPRAQFCRPDYYHSTLHIHGMNHQGHSQAFGNDNYIH